MTLEFREARVDSGPGGALVDAMRAEMADAYPGLVLDGSEMPKAGPAELGPPNGAAQSAHARSLNESEGYGQIGNLNANPVATLFGEKALS